MNKKLRVLYHDNCFDGIASAAVFSRFYRRYVDSHASIEYEGLAHRAGQKTGEDLMSGEENAIVDFKYSPSSRLTWWFDHHESAFLSAEDAAHFRSDTSGMKFLDSSFRSCTKLIAVVSRKTFGCPIDDLDELVHWADIIDGAQFADAKTAVELKEPAMQLMLIIETSQDRELLHRLIRDLQSRSLSEVAAEPSIRGMFDRFYQSHLESIGILRQSTVFRDGVIEFDVSKYELEAYNKFIPYYLFSDSVYCVGVSLSSARAKVSVGTNPWKQRERRQNLAKLCEQYGGGGHSVVAAISFRPQELEDARRTAHEIAEKLRSDLRG